MKVENEFDRWAQRQLYIWPMRIVVLMVPVIIGLFLFAVSGALHGDWPKASDYAPYEREYFR